MPYHPPQPQKKKQVIPLTGVEVRARVVDMCAEVTLVQRYENVEDVPIEATYPTHRSSFIPLLYLFYNFIPFLIFALNRFYYNIVHFYIL
jgi:hypothetical protein